MNFIHDLDGVLRKKLKELKIGIPTNWDLH